jgi:flavin-binding protein dodecin
MFVYLIEASYEGCQDVVFSSVDKAEEYLVKHSDFHSWIVRVEVDGVSREILKPSPAREAMRKASEEEHALWWAEVRENSVCDLCGVKGYNACDCYAETNCGELGGVTKKGTACLNIVAVRHAEKCHLHK